MSTRPESRFHVVCHDCPFEALVGTRRDANEAAAAHEDAHDVDVARVAPA